VIKLKNSPPSASSRTIYRRTVCPDPISFGVISQPAEMILMTLLWDNYLRAFISSMK
jgi:hypothetical protein